MLNKDVSVLSKIVEIRTPVKIIGGIYGLFGNGYRTLAPGDRGSDVLVVQTRLKEEGYYKGTLNCIYGDRLEIALNRFQKSNGLPITNKVRPNLYKKLDLPLFEQADALPYFKFN